MKTFSLLENERRVGKKAEQTANTAHDLLFDQVMLKSQPLSYFGSTMIG